MKYNTIMETRSNSGSLVLSENGEFIKIEWVPKDGEAKLKYLNTGNSRDAHRVWTSLGGSRIHPDDIKLS